MTNIPLKANVACSDGPCGLSTNVIVNPINHKVTHFALRDKSLADNPTRLVPAGIVAGVTPQQIRLTCSKADVEAMPPFIVTHFIPQSAPGYGYATGEAYYSQYVVNDTGYDAVNEPVIPGGEEEVHSGMHVQATDGKVGKLDALVLDPDSGGDYSYPAARRTSVGQKGRGYPGGGDQVQRRRVGAYQAGQGGD